MSDSPGSAKGYAAVDGEVQQQKWRIVGARHHCRCARDHPCHRHEAESVIPGLPQTMPNAGPFRIETNIEMP
jgi:hypothetical protein